MSNRKTIIAGNWKMHKNRQEAKELANQIVAQTKEIKDLPEVVLCPPFTALVDVLSAIEGSPIKAGAQNMDHRDSGAYTGEISPLMLKDLGIKHVIIGHSERRQFFGETNASVNLKVKSALSHGLTPIVCVGESLDERDNSLTDSVVRRQIGSALQDLKWEEVEKIVVAYEPVWAIGTGKNCEAQEANRVAGLIRTTVNDLYKADSKKVGDVIPVLYGGSVKPSNVEEQLALADIDGSLVGGASLKADDFVPLIKAGAKRVSLALSKA